MKSRKPRQSRQILTNLDVMSIGGGLPCRLQYSKPPHLKNLSDSFRVRRLLCRKLRLLGLAGLRLIFTFPIAVRHAVYPFPCSFVVDFDARFVASGRIPLRQAVSAEPGKVHQVDVLNIFVFVQMGE